MFNRFIFTTSHLLRKVGVDFHEDQNPAVVEMLRMIHELGSINFKIEFYPDGSWTAESTNIDGIITGSSDAKEMKGMIKDAVFTYFSIPSYLCNVNLLRGNNEPVTVAQQVWATR